MRKLKTLDLEGNIFSQMCKQAVGVNHSLCRLTVIDSLLCIKVATILLTMECLKMITLFLFAGCTIQEIKKSNLHEQCSEVGVGKTSEKGAHSTSPCQNVDIKTFEEKVNKLYYIIHLSNRKGKLENVGNLKTSFILMLITSVQLRDNWILLPMW